MDELLCHADFQFTCGTGSENRNQHFGSDFNETENNNRHSNDDATVDDDHVIHQLCQSPGHSVPVIDNLCHLAEQSRNAEVEPCSSVHDASNSDINFQASDSENEQCMTTDSDASNSIEKLKPTLEQDLVQWACKHNITHSAVSDLLKMLQSHNFDVPACAKTLLKTPKDIPVQQRSGGDFVYLGLKNGLTSMLHLHSCNPSVSNVSVLKLSFNIDGLPLFSSSSMSLWPILCVITNIIQSKPFAVAIFCGSQKPTNLDFTTEFISELKMLLCNGIEFSGRQLDVDVHSFICDAPAKCLLKGTVQYNGYYGCDRCEQKGVYDGRMTYPETSYVLRSNQSFRSQTNKEHHKSLSPLCELDIDMIKHFPIDYMHQVNLGVTKRLLLLWISGPLKTRLSSNQLEQVSSKLSNIKKFIPTEFARKPRSLQHVRKWKATEFRQFLMYTGPLVLKDVLPKRQYENFMCLHVGFCLLVNRLLVEQHAKYARELMEYFVLDFSDIYGSKFVTYNVHSLVHLTDVAVEYECLENCSAYQFENYLQAVKRLVRSPQKPLEQIVRRLAEMGSSRSVINAKDNGIIVKSNAPNNCFRLCSGNYCIVHDILCEGKEVLCEVFHRTGKLYTEPCDSRLLGIYKIKLQNSVMTRLPVSDLCQKAVFIKINLTTAAVLPLIHLFTG